jgi:5-methylcytosine-specific restriction protein A
MPVSLCLVPRCPNLVRDARSKGRCDDHSRAMERERSARRREVTRGVYKRKKWLMTRKAVLARDPICKVCDERLSTEVDHIVPLSQGGDPWALDNLQGICSPCHWAKTGRENVA